MHNLNGPAAVYNNSYSSYFIDDKFICFNTTTNSDKIFANAVAEFKNRRKRKKTNKNGQTNAA